MSGAQVDSHAFTAFGGARCQVVAVDATANDLSAVVAEVYAFEARLSRFRTDSELSTFNRRAGEGVAVTPLLEALLRAALDAHARSGGLVNAAVLPALVAAGYDRSIEVIRRSGAGPTATAEPAPSLDEVLDVGHGWARLHPGAAVDLGGVGKGWLADRLAERLGDAVVTLGGDLRALGGGPDGNGWCVGLCDGSAVIVRDAGVATSGTAGRRWPGGHHLVDPRTGLPARTDVAAVSVVAADALGAEVLAKSAAISGGDAAVMVANAGGALRVAMVRDLPVAALR